MLGANDVSSTALAACLGVMEAPIAEVDVPVRMTLDRDGHVVSHEATWDGTFPPAVRACLDEVLAGGRFTCPLSGRAEVKANLSVLIQRRR